MRKSQLLIRLPDDVKKKLYSCSIDYDTSMSEIVKLAVVDYLKKHEEQEDKKNIFNGGSDEIE